MTNPINVDELRKIVKSASLHKPFQTSQHQVNLFLAMGWKVIKEEVDAQSEASPVAYSRQGSRYRIFWDSYEVLEDVITVDLQRRYNTYDLTSNVCAVVRKGNKEIECRTVIRLPKLSLPRSTSHSCWGDLKMKESYQKAALLLAWAKLEI